jgi:ATP-dependent helicase/DNAse subunit B
MSVRRFETLLDEIRANVLKGGARAISFEAFADQFLGLVELDVYSLHERDKNRVQVYDVSLARQKEYKVVFVAGLLEKVFPLQIRENALLSDWERRIVNSGLEQPLQECLPRQGLERYLFYLAVTRAKDRLFLCYPHVDLEGKESLPSFYLEEVNSLFGGKIQPVKQDLSRPYPSLEEAITRREREAAVMGELRDAVENGAGTRGMSFPHVLSGNLAHGSPTRTFGDDKSRNPDWPSALQNKESRERIAAALVPVTAKIEDEKIAEGKYFELKEASPTRLEEYAKCPYRYFSNRILKLQDPIEDVTVRQKGTILHWVLEEYFRDFIKAKGKAAPIEEFTERKLKEAFEKYPLTSERKYREELDRAEVKEMLLSVLEKELERLETSGLKPAFLEYGFGSDPKLDAPALKIKMDQKELKIQGRIDRIDTDKEKKLGLIVDYKRTAKFDKTALELGTALQLPLYILAVEKDLGLKPVGGELFSLKEGKRSGFYDQAEAGKLEGGFSKGSMMPEADFRKVLDRTVEFVKRFAGEIEGLKILVRPRDCEKFCPYPAVCRIEKWRLPLILQEIKEEESSG